MGNIVMAAALGRGRTGPVLAALCSPGSTHPQGPENKEDPFINSMMEKD
jgi:hypothetical protein